MIQNIPPWLLTILLFDYSHVWDVLEDECLVELGVAVLPVDLGLVLWFLIRKKVDLDKGVGEAC